jgi:glycogen debranching enzyme
LRTARLAREVWSDPALAERLEAEARELKTRFARDFWDDERGTFLIALAGPNMNGRVDAITSNAGQLLWSGIVDEERAERVAERLLRPDLFSGWGIRTMASEERAYNPLRYHNGTVWPHDTALILAGLRRYGFDRQAARVARALFDAAEAFDHRLPELFSGFARDETDLPIGYPNALAPQAWAAAAPLLALRTVLGLEPDGDELHAHPLDDPLTHGLELRGLQFRGRRVDVP